MKRTLYPFLLALVLLTSLLTPALAAGNGFRDVSESHWASEYIQRAYEADWIHGMGDGRYDPSGNLSRAQFLTMVTNAFFSGETDQVSVPEGSPWYAACWSVAQENGLHTGTAMKDLGDLNGKISRYDMAQVIVNTLSGQGISASAEEARSAQSEIKDWDSVPAGYRDAVSSAYALGILSGRSGKFDGQALMTRAEAAKVLCGMDGTISGGGQTEATPQKPDQSTQKPDNTTQKPDNTTQKPDSTTQKPDNTTQKPDNTTQKPSTTTSTPEELAAEVVRLVNVERSKEGLSPLGTFDSLTKAAQIRAPEVGILFSHDRPDGTSCFTALDQTGAKKGAFTYGENIAAGNATAAETVEQWMNSPGHRANILNPKFTHIGVGYCYDANSTYRHNWVQMFVGTNSTPDGDSGQTPGTNTQKPDNTTQKPSTTTSTPEELAAEVVRLVNVERSKQGLSPLGTFDSLTKAAQIRAPEVGVLFSHDRPDGTSCFTALDQTGAKKGAYTWGENIAAGNAAAAETVEQWMNSPGHRANILNSKYTHIGVGYCYDANSTYRHNWVQMFVGTNSVPDGDSSQTPGTNTQKPDNTTQKPDSTTQTPGGAPSVPEETGGLQFSCPIITLDPGNSYMISVLDDTFRLVSNGVTWTNESPDLLRLNGDGTRVTAIGSSGTGYLTASRGGETARLTVRIIPTADQVTLSCLSLTMAPNGYGTTELYIFSTSKFYGQDCSVSWSVDDPSVLTLEEQVSSQGNPSVRFQALKEGDARITCQVTMADGSTAEVYCFAHVR